MKILIKNIPAILLRLSVFVCIFCLASGCGKTAGSQSTEIVVLEPEVVEETVIPEKEAVSEEMNNEEIEPAAEPEPEPEPDPAEEIIASMTLEQKIWQLFVITPQQLTDGKCITVAPDNFKDYLTQRPVGGIMFFGNNVDDGPEATKALTSTMTETGYEVEGLPLFLCIDEEGGRVARIGCRESYHVPFVGAMGNVKSEERALEVGETIGEYLSQLGFNMDLAPCADVLTDPSNEAIGDRSFGTDPEIVSLYANAFAKGLREYKVLSTYKHFPGHGGAFGDTHDGFISTDKTLDDMLEEELYPFQNLEDADCVMVAHIAAPNITGDDTPASLSKIMIMDILRDKFSFDGLIMCDALNMGAIDAFGTQEEVAVQAVLAGVDLILEPSDIDKAYSGIYEAVLNNTITEERIDESLLRIIHAKMRIEEE